MLTDQPISGKRRLDGDTAAEGWKTVTSKKNKSLMIKNSSQSSENQPKKERIYHFFIEPIKYRSNLLIILKQKVPSIRSIMNKNYIRVSVDTEVEYRRVQ